MISPATDTAADAAAPRRFGLALLLSLACHLPLLWLQLGSPEGARPAPLLKLELRADPKATGPLPLAAEPPMAAPTPPAVDRPPATAMPLDPVPPAALAPPPPSLPTNTGMRVIAVESEQPATVLPPALAASQARTRTEPLAALGVAASAPSLSALPSKLPELAEPVESSEALAAQRQAAQDAAREARRLAEAERLEAERQELARELAAQRERERLAQQQAQELVERELAAQREAQRQAAERAAAERAAAERAEAARQQAERAEAARQQAERAEAARREAERLEAERQAQLRAEAARRDAESQERARQEAARQEAERAEAARRAAAQVAAQAAAQAAAREEAARAEAARLKAAERAADDERREAARRAMGRQLDAEAAQREAEAAAARQGQAGPRGALPHAWSTARRYRLYGRSDPNPEIQQYAEAWARKIHLNTPVELVRELAAQPHQAPLVTVAIRRDGTVEAVTLVNRSGVAAVDDAVRRIVQMHQPFQAFAPGMAADFDVIEIRRSWHFNPTAVWLQ